jgi:DNA primase
MTVSMTCPACGRSNFKLTEHNGFAYCFNCGYKESDDNSTTDKIAPSENIDTFRALYKEAAQYYHSCLQEAHRQYLNKRGITDETISARMIGYCPKDVHMLYKHHLSDDSGMTFRSRPTLADRIVFPYQFGDMIIDLRGRMLAGSGEKYKSLMKSSMYRGAMFAYNVDMHDDTIVVTEGEIKAIIPAQYGIAVHGLPGILSSRMIARKPYKKAIIVLDSQRDMREIHRAIRRLARRVDNPHVSILPLHGKEKQDIDSYILEHGIDAFKRLLHHSLDFDRWEEIHGYKETDKNTKILTSRQGRGFKGI